MRVGENGYAPNVPKAYFNRKKVFNEIMLCTMKSEYIRMKFANADEVKSVNTRRQADFITT